MEEFSSIIGGGCECESDSDPEAEDATRNDDEEDNVPVQDVSGVDSHVCAQEVQKKAAEFLSFVKDECTTTQKTVKAVIDGVDELFQLYNKYLQAKLLSLSDSDSVLKEDIVSVLDYMKNQTLFEGVQTLHRMEQYQQLKWKSLVPQKLILSWKKDLVNGQVKRVADHVAYYVDFLSQLEFLLQCDDVLHSIDNPEFSTDGVYRCALDGYIYQNHPVRQKCANAIGIILYLDDALTLESLTTYQDNSVRNYSWSIANISPELRSSLRAVNLLALAKTSVAKKCKNGPILDNFVKGINRLSSDEGVTFTIHGVERKFFGFLLFVIGDYPALANIGGFKESAALAWRFCRQCLVTQLEYKRVFHESNVTLRTAEVHQQHLEAIGGIEVADEVVEDEEIDGMSEEPQDQSSKYGVNSASPLLKVNYFDVTQCLPQDIMHLFLEGIIESGCRLLLRHAIEDKKLTLKYVNNYIASHNYGNLVNDKPSPIQPQHLKNGLRQTSSQTLMLSGLVPFIVKGHCDPAKLVNFISLLMIFSICMARENSFNDVKRIQTMIAEYLQQFNALYPGQMTPKHHFLIHLATQILLFSVLTEQWAMRFEAFFSRLKRLTKVLHNARNLSFTLMTRVCSRLSYQVHMHSHDFLKSSAVQPKVNCNVIVSTVPYKECLVSCLSELSDESQICELTSLKWYGSILSTGNIFVLCRNSENELPDFAVIAKLYSFCDKYIVVFKKLLTKEFHPDVNAYRIESTRLLAFGATVLTKRFNILEPVYICHGSVHYVFLRRDNNPSFNKLQELIACN